MKEEIIDEDKNSRPKRICSYAYKKNKKALNLHVPNKKNMSEPSHDTDSLILFNSIIGRLFNKPETLEKIGVIEPDKFNDKSFVTNVRKIDRP